MTQTELMEVLGLTRKQIQKVVKELQEEGRAVCQSQYRSMNQSRKYMWRW